MCNNLEIFEWIWINGKMICLLGEKIDWIQFKTNLFTNFEIFGWILINGEMIWLLGLNLNLIIDYWFIFFFREFDVSNCSWDLFLFPISRIDASDAIDALTPLVWAHSSFPHLRFNLNRNRIWMNSTARNQLDL